MVEGGSYTMPKVSNQGVVLVTMQASRLVAYSGVGFLHYESEHNHEASPEKYYGQWLKVRVRDSQKQP